MDPTERKLTALWGVMVILTLSSYSASESWFNHGTIGVALVIALAFLKARFVILDFMEVRHAPLSLRVLLEVWIVGVAGMLIVLAH